MSFRKSSPAAPAERPSGAAPAADPARTAGKGRPTRSRREAEAARHRPLVVTDRKEARRRSREKAQQERTAAQRALVTGDEAHMPPQHRGPQRRFTRDYVDARHNVAEYFVPIALVLMFVAMMLPFFIPQHRNEISLAMMILMWGGIAVCAIDMFVMRRGLNRALTARFGGVAPGTGGYAIMRAIQFRRLRLPKPMIRHGESPRG